jgi:hypothetical protein
MIMIVAAVLVLSLCAVRSRGFVIREDLGAIRFDMTALIDCRVETHPAPRGDNDTAN